MSTEKKHIFDNPQNVRKVLYGLLGSLVLLLAIEPFVLKHPYFAWEKWFGFYAIFGLPPVQSWCLARNIFSGL